MNITNLLSRCRAGHGIIAYGFDRFLSTFARVLGKTQVVVGAQVEGVNGLATILESPVVVVGHALHNFDVGARHGADGSVEAVPDAGVQVARVKALVLRVQGHEVTRVVVQGALFS